MAELSMQSNQAVLNDSARSEGSSRHKHEGSACAPAVWGWAVRWMSRVWRKVETITVQSTQGETEGSTVSAAQLLVDSKMPGEVSKRLAAHLSDWTNSKNVKAELMVHRKS